MWRLKISQGGQFVRTCRGYLGRETWEFDEQLGSSDERATVERVREEFSLNRFDKTQSSDFLARMQLAKENNFDIMRKKTKSQNKKGGVEAAVISLYVTESFNFLLLEHQKEIRRYLYNTQNKDGGWGLHAGCSSCMLSTSLGYICLRLLGEEAENEKLCEVRTWIHDHGGATMIPSWGKVWLAIFGVYEWSGVNPLPPELFLLPFLPIHPGRALKFIENYMQYEEENSRYIWVSGLQKILENPSGDFRRYFRHITKGGWSFSTVDQQWPVSDCTSEALKALLLLSDISPDIVGEHITSERLYDGVNLLLSLQSVSQTCLYKVRVPKLSSAMCRKRVLVRHT
ncbi:hypothetical protein LUZ60_011481 [Juncus effusus]|nr:hypothetical protein LUZ60_011481 [Juncus effusus]